MLYYSDLRKLFDFSAVTAEQTDVDSRVQYINNKGQLVYGTMAIATSPVPSVSLNHTNGFITAKYKPVLGRVVSDSSLPLGYVSTQFHVSDSNLVSENIARGVSIFGIDGTYGLLITAGYAVNDGTSVKFMPLNSELSLSMSYLKTVNTGVTAPDYSETRFATVIYYCRSVDTTNHSWVGYIWNRLHLYLERDVCKLSYKGSTAPTVGKFYVLDGTIQCNPFYSSTLRFYTPLRWSYDYDILGGYLNWSNISKATWLTVDGVSCMITAGLVYSNYGTGIGLYGANPFTFSCFAKKTAGLTVSGKQQFILSYGTATAKQQVGLCINDAAGYHPAIGGEGIFVEDATTSGTSWTHLLAKYDGTTLYFYVNGSLKQQQAVTFSLNSSDSRLIGRQTSSLANSAFVGSIALCKIYSEALSDDKITALYNRLHAMIIL